MKATVVDLRYRMKDVLRALARNEDVSVLHRGTIKGVLRPVRKQSRQRVAEHPFFNMRPSTLSVTAQMKELRGGRYRAV